MTQPAFVSLSKRYQAHKAAQPALPQMPEGQATVFVALSVLIMAYSGLMSMVPILVFYALWFPYIFYKGRFTLALTKETWLAYAFAGYCVLSVVWSDYPMTSLRAGLQLSSMIVCALIIGRMTNMKVFLNGIVLGSFVVLAILPILNNVYGFSVFGSKNQIGLFAEIGLVASLMLFFNGGRFFYRLLMGALALFTGWNLIESYSAGSWVSFAATALFCGVLFFVSGLSKKVRMGMLVIMVLFASIGFGLAAAYGAQETGLQFLGKDATLTGRTYLWGEGIKTGIDSWFLGHGYYAFWVPGNPPADRYWSEFHLQSGSGFHFHNLFIQTFVDVGAVGLILLVALMLGVLLRGAFALVYRGLTLEVLAVVGFSFMFFVRSFVEVDILGPYGIGLLISFSLLPRVLGEKEVRSFAIQQLLKKQEIS